MTGRDGTGVAVTVRRSVGIAEYAVSAEGVPLVTSGLGSCIGLALFDPATDVAGLAHLMLPAAPAVGTGGPAKFADAGTDRLVEEMAAAGANPARLVAKLAGGSDMLSIAGTGIGRRNAAAVRETLGEHGIPIVAEDVGGDRGRSLRLEPATGDLVVRSATDGARRL